VAAGQGANQRGEARHAGLRNPNNPQNEKLMNMNEHTMESFDRQVGREMDRLTSGADAHHRARRPDEEAMDHEDGGDDPAAARDALREEIFSGTCDYTLGAGLHPGRIRERMAVVMGRFDPESLMKMRGSKCWWDEVSVQKTLEACADRVGQPCYGTLFALSGKIREEKDQLFVYQSFKGLCGFWTMEGYEWRKAVCAHLAIVKALRSELIGGMSLEEIAVLCGDKGKATVSARAKRLFNRRLAAMGMHGTFAHFQKSPAACESYRAAQMGNTNRRKGKKAS